MVVVAANGKFHSFGLASALDRRGLLARLYTPYYSQQNRIVARFVRRQDKELIAPARVRTNVLAELPLRIGAIVGLVAPYMPHAKGAYFDCWVAHHLKREHADIFLGWSSSSLKSLSVAHQRGMTTIVTRGSSHICYQDDILAQEYERRGRRYTPSEGIRERELAEYAAADFIRIPSSYVQRTFLAHGVAEGKLLRTPYVADLTHFSPQPRVESERLRVLFFNATSIRKGFYYAADLIHALNADRFPADYWFIGAPDDEVVEDMRRLVDGAPNVRAFGRVNYYEAAPIISQCHVGVFPTVEEGLANTLLQTLACGVPVIATINSGVEDVVTDGVEGFITPVMELDPLLEKIRWCGDHRAECTAMGLRAAARARVRTWDDVIDEMLARAIKQ